jgi:hypothetical protein
MSCKAPGAFARAILEHDIGTVQAAFAAIVEGSYVRHPMRHTTQAEHRRRGEILVKWFRTLREEKKWALDRALQALPDALDAELDGRTYEPSSSCLYGANEALDALVPNARKTSPLITLN